MLIYIILIKVWDYQTVPSNVLVFGLCVEFMGVRIIYVFILKDNRAWACVS